MARILLRSAKSKRHAIPTGRNGAFPRMGIVAKPLKLQGKNGPKTGKNGPQMAQNFLQLGNKTACQSCNPLKSLKSPFGPLFGCSLGNPEALNHAVPGDHWTGRERGRFYAVYR